MEVKPGYKQTEVGVIPNDWDAKPLGSVLSKGRLGGNYSNQDAEAELPLMKMGNLARGYIDLSKVQFITPGVRPELAHRLVYGDVLFNTRNTLDLVGKVAIWRDELPVSYYNSNLMRLEFDPEQVCSNEYANYSLNTEGAVSRLRALATGTTSVAAIYTRDLMKLQVLVPTLPEQRAIAMALSDVDGLLGRLDRLIAKKRDLKQAAMQQLLAGQTRLPGFHGEWEVKRLKTIVQTPVTDGPHLTPQFLDDGIPFLSVNNLVENRIDLTDVRFISRADHEVFSRKCKPRKHDILFGKAASVGKVALVELDIEFNIWSPIAMIRINCDNAPRFVYFQLQSRDLIGQIALLTNSSSQGNIGMGDIEKLTINLPPLREQVAIAEVLTEMEAELAALEQRREKTRALKQAMMQELLTGRTRLVPPQGTHA